LANDGFGANGGFEANEGFTANEGFVANEASPGSSGPVANGGASNSGFEVLGYVHDCLHCANMTLPFIPMTF
jgi:hypothetical protein